MREIYNKVAKIINRINFSTLWSGFHPYSFAIYDHHTVYLEDREIPWDEKFIGCTAIEYEGETIAIWDLELALVDDLDILAANLVHEMFHVYQRECNEKRHPNDLQMIHYPMNGLNFEYKHAENLILIQALQQNDSSEAKELLNQFCSFRKLRQKIVDEYIQCEYYTETIEGMAEFVGTSALKQINEEKYNERLKAYINKLSQIDSLLFDIRKQSYYTGTLFLIALQKIGFEVNQNLNVDKSIFELYADEAPNVSVEQTPSTRIVELMHEFIQTREQKIADFFKEPTAPVEIESKIVGYDPMNMVKSNQQLLCRHFILLKDNNMETHFIKGPVVVQLAENSFDRVLKYYVHKAS